MKKFIEKIKEELTMKGYLNGWLIKYYKDKLKELEDKDEKQTP